MFHNKHSRYDFKLAKSLYSKYSENILKTQCKENLLSSLTTTACAKSIEN